jgi:hypothetical protein
MGHSAQACALSGLSIGEGEECYAVILTRNLAFQSRLQEAGCEIVRPPIRGIFDEYGGFKLTEDVNLSTFNRASGDTWRWKLPEAGHSEGVAFINARVFDRLGELEGRYQGQDTVGAGAASCVEAMREIISEARSKKEGRALASQGMRAMLSICRDVDNWQSWSDGVEEVEKKVTDGEDAEDILKFYERAITLQFAQVALRKIIVPGIVGPQDAVDTALRQFHEVVGGELERKADLDKLPSP